MELSEVVLLIGIFLPILGTSVWMLNRTIPAKKNQKTADKSISDLYHVYNRQVEDILKLKDRSLASLQKKNEKLEDQLTGSDEEDEEQTIDPTTLIPMVKKVMPHLQDEQIGALLNSPMIKEKLTKGNLDSIQSYLPLLSLLQPKPSDGNVTTNDMKYA